MVATNTLDKRNYEVNVPSYMLSDATQLPLIYVELYELLVPCTAFFRQLSVTTLRKNLSIVIAPWRVALCRIVSFHFIRESDGI